MKPGVRVYAIYGSEGDKVEVFGPGVFLGKKVPGEDPSIPVPVGPLGDMVREAGLDNPLIRLDTGQYVWGCECWWGSEAAAMKHIGAQPTVVVDIDEVRAQQPREEKEG